MHLVCLLSMCRCVCLAVSVCLVGDAVVGRCVLAHPLLSAARCRHVSMATFCQQPAVSVFLSLSLSLCLCVCASKLVNI